MKAYLLVYAPGVAARTRLAARLGEDIPVTFCTSLVETIRQAVSAPPRALLAVLDEVEDPARECELLCALGDFAVITVLQRLDPQRAAACLDRGADSVLPLDAPEFARRVQAILQRVRRDEPSPGLLVAGDLVVDRHAHVARWRGRTLDLTPIEFAILSVLAEQPGRVVSTRELLARVWGPAYVDDVHYIRLYIGYLRAKLEDDPRHPRVIRNQWGVGYRLTVIDPVPSVPAAAR